MNPSTVEFEPVVWPHLQALHSSQRAPVRLTAQIVPPKPLVQCEGTLVACGVHRDQGPYLILDRRESDEYRECAEERLDIYQAFRSELRIDPAVRPWIGWSEAPYLMCRSARLERYDARPYWGWEVHRVTPGECWELLPGQNVERRRAPANQWGQEIQGELLPRMRARLEGLPKLLERAWRLQYVRWGPIRPLEPLVPEAVPATVTHHDLLRDNLVGAVEGDSRGWRLESFDLHLDSCIGKLREEFPRLQRRLVQAQWLLTALRPLGTQPLEMQRTLLRAEREFSLPVPTTPLAIAVRKAVTPGVRIRMR